MSKVTIMFWKNNNTKSSVQHVSLKGVGFYFSLHKGEWASSWLPLNGVYKIDLKSEDDDKKKYGKVADSITVDLNAYEIKKAIDIIKKGNSFWQQWGEKSNDGINSAVGVFLLLKIGGFFTQYKDEFMTLARKTPSVYAAVFDMATEALKKDMDKFVKSTNKDITPDSLHKLALANVSRSSYGKYIKFSMVALFVIVGGILTFRAALGRGRERFPSELVNIKPKDFCPKNDNHSGQPWWLSF